MWKIAEGNNMTWQQLAEINQLKNPHLIYPGQVLKLAGGQPESVSSASVSEKSEVSKPQNTSSTPVVLEPDTYVGEGKGIHGTIQVGVTLDGNKITSVKVIKHDETPGVSDLAIKEIPENIVKYQSVAVDTVAGATMSSKGVVLATGGFDANIEMRDKYNKIWPTLTNIKTTNHPGATGDGMLMAEKVGANLVGLEQIQLLPMGDPVTGSLSGNIEQGVENRIFVNKDGNRFVDEGARRDVMTKALFAQKNAFMWVVFDKHSYPTGATKNNFNETIDQLVADGRAYKGDTLEDLAKQIGVNPENLIEDKMRKAT